MRTRILVVIAAAVAVFVAACGADEGADSAAGPSIVVTTTVLGDVVEQLVGDDATVTVIMPRGTDPHGFQPSAQQVAAMTGADALIANGAGFEEGLVDAVRAAESDGVPTFEAIRAVSSLTLPDGETVDPHFFTDPDRMADAAEGIVDFLSTEVPAFVDLELASAPAYVDRLRELDLEVEDIVAVVPADARLLVTNHEVLDYFADRYEFEVVGTVVPGASTNDAVSARDLDSLATTIRSSGVRAIFVETSSPSQLADTLAAEAGVEVAVVELFTESLGADGSGGATYVDMVRTNATRIAEALGGGAS
ncbi:metal ABC transporter solute-binding protein, Zn/Mn family [Actinospongicola halichondriae]|uniref:metal ABC transporter solute-binding protein, Zn/Mn family n=1 Tax=Actinospongicola halichondriae TaxID=3236844 RepID=UPI003D3ACCCA